MCVDIIDSKSDEYYFIPELTERINMVLFTMRITFVHCYCTIRIRQLNFSLKAM